MRPRTIVVDDHVPFRNVMVGWLRATDRVDIVADVGLDDCTPQALDAWRPELLLLGLGSAEGGGLSIVERAKAAAGSRVVVLSFLAVREFEAAVRAKGADGFVPKYAVTEKLPVLLDELFSRAEPAHP